MNSLNLSFQCHKTFVVVISATKNKLECLTKKKFYSIATWDNGNALQWSHSIWVQNKFCIWALSRSQNMTTKWQPFLHLLQHMKNVTRSALNSMLLFYSKQFIKRNNTRHNDTWDTAVYHDGIQHNTKTTTLSTTTQYCDTLCWVSHFYWYSKHQYAYCSYAECHISILFRVPICWV